MNRNEFENRMKDNMKELPFQPQEDLWLKLNADLQQPAGRKHRSMLFLPWMKIAASVVIVLSLGVATSYFIQKDNTTNTPAIAIQQPGTPTPSANGKAPDTNSTSVNPAMPYSPPVMAAQHTAKNQGPATGKVKTPLIPEKQIVVPQVAQSKTPEPEHGPLTDPIPAPKTPGSNTQRPTERWKEPMYADNNKTSGQAVNVGMSANVGRSTISSNIGYQVGVVGRGNLSKKIFVEAGIVVASNTVSNSSTHSFPGIELGNDGFSNVENKKVNKVKADYARNIISVGITPSVGFKVTPRLSVATGGAIYRNLNPSLELTNGDAIESTALTNDIISTTQGVTTWDIGLTCNADYKVTHNLSLNVNYRKGLTDYLQQENKYIRNSGVQLGLKFLFGK